MSFITFDHIIFIACALACVCANFVRGDEDGGGYAFGGIFLCGIFTALAIFFGCSLLYVCRDGYRWFIDVVWSNHSSVAFNHFEAQMLRALDLCWRSGACGAVAAIPGGILGCASAPDRFRPIGSGRNKY